jgi:hypothetical protein
MWDISEVDIYVCIIAFYKNKKNKKESGMLFDCVMSNTSAPYAKYAILPLASPKTHSGLPYPAANPYVLDGVTSPANLVSAHLSTCAHDLQNKFRVKKRL